MKGRGTYVQSGNRTDEWKIWAPWSPAKTKAKIQHVLIMHSIIAAPMRMTLVTMRKVMQERKQAVDRENNIVIKESHHLQGISNTMSYPGHPTRQREKIQWPDSDK